MKITLALHTAISRKVVGKSTRNNPKRHFGWFWIHCSPKKFERMTREAMDVCLQELKESNKSRFDSYSVRNSVLIISHITFWDCRVHIFSDNLSRNSCIKMGWNLANDTLFSTCRAETNQRHLGLQEAYPLLPKRPYLYGNLGMDKENDLLVKRKYAFEPESRGKLFDDMTNNGFAVGRHLPELGFGQQNLPHGYIRPRILSDFR